MRASDSDKTHSRHLKELLQREQTEPSGANGSDMQTIASHDGEGLWARRLLNKKSGTRQRLR